jgi:hypothetical protein
LFERFTDRARRVLVLAQEEARLLNHSFIGTEHILLGLIHEGEGVAAVALRELGISLEAVREKVEETIGMAGSDPSGSPPFTPRAKKVLELSLREALQLGHSYIGTEHMLLGLVREGEGVAAQVLVSLGADLGRVRQQVIQLMSGYQGEEAVGGSWTLPVGKEEPPPSASLEVSGLGGRLEFVVHGFLRDDILACAVSVHSGAFHGVLSARITGSSLLQLRLDLESLRQTQIDEVEFGSSESWLSFVATAINNQIRFVGRATDLRRGSSLTFEIMAERNDVGVWIDELLQIEQEFPPTSGG